MGGFVVLGEVSGEIDGLLAVQDGFAAAAETAGELVKPVRYSGEVEGGAAKLADEPYLRRLGWTWPQPPSPPP